jgi:GYF domain 2
MVRVSQPRSQGPYTKLQLWEIQDITARTKVRREQAEWQRAGEIPELAAYLTQKSGAIPKKLFSAGWKASGQLQIFRSNRFINLVISCPIDQPEYPGRGGFLRWEIVGRYCWRTLPYKNRDPSTGHDTS